jgi:hypothetical protein
MGLNLAISGFFKDCHHFFDVESFSLIVVKFMEFTIRLQLRFVELLTAMDVNKVPLASKRHPAMLVNTSTFLIDEEALT